MRTGFRSRPQQIVGIGIVAVLIVGAWYFLKEPPRDFLKDFENSVRASLPRCFSTVDLSTIAKGISSRDVRCRPINLVLLGQDPTSADIFHDPLPWKLICMPNEKLPEQGTIRMAPPLLLLTVDKRCVTKVNTQ